jgi:ketosteroid isomerase-like protein
MNTNSFVLLSVLLLTSAFYAQDKYADPDQAAMVASERAFSAATAYLGVTEGFLTFFSTSSSSFDSDLGKAFPKLIAGKRSTYPLKSTLTWAPESGDISKSGDFGFLYGPWIMQKSSSDSIFAKGRYISIWIKDTLGLWKVAFDCGVETNEKDTIPAKVFFTGISDSSQYANRKPAESGKAKGTLMRLETVFAKLNGVNEPSDADSILSDRIILFRDKGLPLKGKSDAKELYHAIKSGSYRIAGIEIAPSTDIAYTYGSCGINMDAYYYLHIWQIDESANWRLVVDVCAKK